MKAFAGEGEILADTVYFGGGTPSLLSPLQLEKILNAVKKGFILKDNAEITLECNPSSKGLEELLTAAGKNGVNRISLGMQSSSDRERRLLGRTGGRESVEKAMLLAKKAGIDNISLDVMVGVPESTISSLEDSLKFAVSSDAAHISAYLLKLEEGTFYYKNAHKLSLPSEDEVADMYMFMSDYLREKGYFHYEISNFCRDGKYSRHNMKYWDRVPYLGFGPSAHSFYKGKRFYFPADTESFINGASAVYDGEGGDEEEAVLLSLRTHKGISLEDKNEAFRKKAEKFAFEGFGEIRDSRFVLTAKGYLVSNSIISELLSVF